MRFNFCLCLALLVGIYIGIVRSAVALKICKITAGIKSNKVNN